MNDIIQQNLDTDNWFTYKQLYTKFAELAKERDYKNIVEVGVWKGHSLSFLANLLKGSGINIHAVDLFEDSYEYDEFEGIPEYKHKIFDIFMENLKRVGVEDDINIIKGYSWDMADEFEDNSLDIVFIDADHEYESVKKDINAWYPKVKQGGIIAGHDWFSHPGVSKAIVEYLGTDENINTDESENVWWMDV